MTKPLAGIVLALAAAGLALAPSAGASPPTTDTIDYHPSNRLRDICPFAIQWRGHAQIRDMVWTNHAGVVVKITDHVVEQDTFSANGHTIRSDTYHYAVHWVFDKAGNLLHAYATGVVIRMRLPNGTLFNAAGRVDVLTSNEAFSITPDTGHSGDIRAFCQALS
jgi:hypothetical protein